MEIIPWGSEAVIRKTRILDLVYNASNNELVRTQTLVKSEIVQVDAVLHSSSGIFNTMVLILVERRRLQLKGGCRGK